MNEYRTNVENYLKTHPETTIDEIIGTKTIKKQEFGILFTTLPYKTILTQSKYSEISDNLRHKIQFSVFNEDIFGEGKGMSYTASIPELAGKRITLSYIPATPEDEALINSYLPKPHPDNSPIQPNEFPTSLPAYMFNLKPELKIEGITKAIGSQIGMGQDQTFTMNFIEPQKGMVDSVVNTIIAGEFYGIGLNVGRVSTELIEKKREKIKTTKELLEKGQTETLSKDDLIGEFLSTTALGYFYELDTFNRVIAKMLGTKNIRFPSEAMVSFEMNISYLFGTPISASFSGMGIDIDRDVEAVISTTQDKSNEKNYMILSGMIGSGLEHGVLEQIFSTKEKPAYGISAVKILKVANDLGIPIYTINKENISKVLPNLEVSQDVKVDIQNSVNAGKIVTISKTEITYAGWNGVGYIVMDPETGAAGYLISGGIAGGFLCELGMWFLLISLIPSPLSFQLMLSGAFLIWTGLWTMFYDWVGKLPKETQEMVWNIVEIIEIISIAIIAAITAETIWVPLAIFGILCLIHYLCEQLLEYFEKKSEEHGLFEQRRVVLVSYRRCSSLGNLYLYERL